MRNALSLLERPNLDRRALVGYRRERITELSVPIALALMEGGFVGVVADKVYHAHPALLALITATPMMANLSSFLWARLARGRRKVPFVTALQAGMVAGVAGVALAPDGPLGAWVLVGCMMAVRLMLAGSITVRSTIWSLNYPADVRARYAGRLQILTTVTIVVSSFVASRVLDASPENFRLIYAGAALLAMGGVVAFAGVPHLREQELLALESGRNEDDEGPSRGLFAVLRDDPEYARYQACQFALGTSNMMIEGPIIYLVSRELGADYTVSIAITLGIPLALTALTIPLWAIYVDRVHIAHFRARQSWLWVLSQVLTMVGALMGSIAVLVGARVVLGIARGGGSLAWNLGHNDFSSERDLAAYMGANVTLTGVRGMFAPFLGMLLYVGTERIPGFSGIGAWTFGAAAALSTLSAAGFILLARRIRV